MLSGEKDSMSGLFVDFDLGMVGAHMTLTAGARESRDGHGTRVASVTSGAISNRAVILGLTNGVTLRATAANSRRSLQLSKSIGGPLDVARVIFFRKISLFLCETLFTENRGPRGCGMAAAEELLIDLFVTSAAVAGSDRYWYDESMVLFFLLPLLRLMAVQARNSLRGVLAQLVFMDYGILLVGVAFRALACGFNEVCGRLIDLNAGPRSMQQESAQNEGEGNSNRDKNRTE